MFVKDLAADTFFVSDPDNELIKLTEWTSGVEEMPIDISYRDVLRFTNCATIQEGVGLMEFACQVNWPRFSPGSAKIVNLLIC